MAHKEFCKMPHFTNPLNYLAFLISEKRQYWKGEMDYSIIELEQVKQAKAEPITSIVKRNASKRGVSLTTYSTIPKV